MRTGKVSENVLKRSVLRQIKQKRQEIINGAGIGEDCAILSFPGEENLVTCVQEASALFESDKNWVARLIVKCANNVAAAGGEPVAVLLAFMLPQDTEESELKALMKQAEDACHSLGIAIAGGHTTVTGAVSVPVATATGYGRAAEKTGPEGLRKSKNYSVRAVAPGQDVVISKWIGLEGTAILARYCREKLLERYPSYFVDEAAGFDRYLSLLPEAATAVKSGVCAMHDASEGGIFGALWELAEGAGVGLTIDLKKLPIRQETVEVCEQCNVNPYELMSGGCLIMTTEDGPGLVTALEAEQIPAAIVGKVTDSNDRIILNEDEVRYMEKAQQDEIYHLQTGE